MPEQPTRSREEIFAEDGRYSIEAVDFIHEALAYTVEELYGSQGSSGERRHVTGQQLCEGLRRLAIKKWGLLAREVLAHWGIYSTMDFGEIVFLLVNNGYLHKRPEDSIEDFRDVYSFDEAFGCYEIPFKQSA